jgi:hypothetical protein
MLRLSATQHLNSKIKQVVYVEIPNRDRRLQDDNFLVGFRNFQLTVEETKRPSKRIPDFDRTNCLIPGGDWLDSGDAGWIGEIILFA